MRQTGLACLIGLLLLGCLAWLTQQQQQASGKQDSPRLSLSVWGSGEELAVLKPLLHRFETQWQAQTGEALRIEVQHAPESYAQKLQLWLGAGQASDVMMLNNQQLPLLAEAGKLRPLLLSPEAKELYEPLALAGLSYKGRCYALPRDASVVAVYVNESLLAAAGLPLPRPHWHWQEALALSIAFQHWSLKHPTPQALPRWAWSFYQQPSLFFLPFVLSEGGDLYRLPWDAATQKGLARYHALRWQQHLAPQPQELGQTTQSELFLNQRLLFWISGPWSRPLLASQARFRWRVLPFPATEAGHSVVGVDATGYAVSAQSTHPAAAEALARFLTSEASASQWAASGLLLPALRSPVAPSTQQTARPDAFKEALKNGRPTSVSPRFSLQNRCLQEVLEPYFLNTSTALETQQRVQKQCAAAFR